MASRYCKLSMVGKGIRGGICQAIYQYAKASSKYMKDYDKNKESSYINKIRLKWL